MSLGKIKIANKGLLEPDSSNLNELEFGNTYLMFSTEFGIQEKLFSSYNDQVSFINSPFRGALTIAHYDEIDPISRLKSIDLINSFNIYPPISGYAYLDKILVLMSSQLLENNIVVIETTGLDEISVIKLINYSVHLLKDFKDRLIIMMDFYYSAGSKVWIALAKESALESNITDYLPAKLIRVKKSMFKIKSS